jgi:thiamine biosynthesis lipoprotein
MNFFEFEALGTLWRIDIYDSVNSQSYEDLRKGLIEKITLFEQSYSRFQANNVIAAISSRAGRYDVGIDGVLMLQEYLKLYRLSHGVFTPLIGEILYSLGYDSNYTFVKKEPIKIPELNDVIRIIDECNIQIHHPVKLDLGGVGKGFLIDKLKENCTNFGIKEFSIDGGGDIFICKSNPMVIGLENPMDNEEILGTVSIANGALCASSNNRRKWGDYAHIISPGGEKMDNVLASWVRADSAFIADAIATCLFFVKPEILQQEYAFDYLILNPDFGVEYSHNFGAQLFS